MPRIFLCTKPAYVVVFSECEGEYCRSAILFCPAKVELGQDINLEMWLTIVMNDLKGRCFLQDQVLNSILKTVRM